MDVISPFTYIDPSIENIDFLNADGRFTVPFDNPGPLASNSDLNQILDSNQSSSIVPQLPCYPPDRAWNTLHHEEK